MFYIHILIIHNKIQNTFQRETPSVRNRIDERKTAYSPSHTKQMSLHKKERKMNLEKKKNNEKNCRRGEKERARERRLRVTARSVQEHESISISGTIA